MKPRVMLTVIVAFGALGCRREVPVLLYHEVGCGTQDLRDVPLEQFEAELGYLETHGYQVVPLASVLATPESLPRRAVAISFDDGAACLHDGAFPLLRKHHMPFTLFLVNDWIASDEEHRVTQDVADGEKVPSLTRPEVREMIDSGLASVGGHGRTHLRLNTADAAQIENEVVSSREALAASLDIPVELFAYPYGAFDRRAVAAARRAGYAGAMSVSNGTGGRYAYRRRSIHRGLSERDFAAELGEQWILPLLDHD